jgi:hypothetical protein
MRPLQSLGVLLVCLTVLPTCAQEGKDAAKPDGKPDASKLPHMSVDLKLRQVRVECEALDPQMPLEFFVCMSGTAEHEAVFRSDVKPSHMHLGLLMLGLQPGEPVHFSRAKEKWLPPHGPPLHIFCEWEGKDGKTVRVPAYRMMRNVKSKKEMPATTWIFAGSRVMEDGKYAADTTGYLVSVVNFDLTVVDIPELASNANEALEWEANPDVKPAKGTKMWMILEAAGKEGEGNAGGDAKPAATAGAGATAAAGATGNAAAAQAEVNPFTSEPVKPAGAAAPAAGAGEGNGRISDVTIDDRRVKALRAEWDKIVQPRKNALQEAARKHYEVLNALRREQNRLIDEADRIQRVIDQVQKEYQDMTTPKPESEDAPKGEPAK